MGLEADVAAGEGFQAGAQSRRERFGTLPGPVVTRGGAGRRDDPRRCRLERVEHRVVELVAAELRHFFAEEELDVGALVGAGRFEDDAGFHVGDAQVDVVEGGHLPDGGGPALRLVQRFQLPQCLDGLGALLLGEEPQDEGLVRDGGADLPGVAVRQVQGDVRADAGAEDERGLVGERGEQEMGVLGVGLGSDRVDGPVEPAAGQAPPVVRHHGVVGGQQVDEVVGAAAVPAAALDDEEQGAAAADVVVDVAARCGQDGGGGGAHGWLLGRWWAGSGVNRRAGR
ncbi:hypothetical protein AAIO99_22045 [Streptomyces sp. AC154]